MIEVMVVDDHPVVSSGMEALLGAQPDFKVRPSAFDGQDALERIRREGCPDVIVADVNMPRMNGFDMLSAMRRFYPDVRVLFLAGMPAKVELERAQRERARGYLPKSTEWRRLVEVIRNVAADGPFAEETFVPQKGPLTDRELDVLRYVAEGKTKQEVGIILGIGLETVKSHTRSILRKLDVVNAPAAIARAYELQLLK